MIEEKNMDEQKDIRIVEEKESFMDRVKNIQPIQIIVPAVILVLFIGTIVGIVNYRQRARREQNPKIEITSPQDGQIFEEAQIVVEGTTYPNTKIAVNAKEVGVDNTGKFAMEVPLNDGLNEITITAESTIGKKTEAKRVITRTVVAPIVAQASPETTATVVAKTAQSQKLNSSGPESFWIPEILSLSGVGSAWYMSRKNLKKALKK
jgi:hypothetical protein